MNRNRTSVMLQEGTLERLKEQKPFESMSHNEFIGHLLDHYERSPVGDDLEVTVEH